MNRRRFTIALGGLSLTPLISFPDFAQGGQNVNSDKIVRSEEEWRRQLTPEQFKVMREEGTERAGTSPLLGEKRQGKYVCVGCGLALFSSETKYESGTGWPSFYQPLPGALETKRDFKLIWPRTEYHCARCGGHQGHVFEDGPKPTGLRYCNNGVALRFEPGES